MRTTETAYVHETVEKFEAVQVPVKVSGSIEEYAKAFLNIFNNVKSNDELLQVYNDYGNTIYVVCERESEQATITWLKHFGEVLPTERVICKRFLDGHEYDIEQYAAYIFIGHQE